ncbi:glycoside hydrolase family 31 protein [Mucilaginibacter terrae]|uniref:Alpha-D-xyloside xylohydrolase n=1 Tax=Mucilaginibacter terrae TaxID=1955052 RepID=A0ABU3GQC6_9SPHI|nr:TIM-barrel domain-containing protein [Mucilaginibacter terrae]MDT3401984.1 alpha-D-xyloside xylohydrolase [Mucilaginibacter terrae]
MYKPLLKVTVLALAILPGLCHAQSFSQTAQGVKADVGSQSIEIQFYSPSIVRVIKTTKGETLVKESLSVIKKAEQVAFSSKKTSENLNLSSKALTVSLNLKTGEISYATPNGKKLLSEFERGEHFTTVNDAGSKALSIYQAFKLDNDEPIYGLGQHQGGALNQRGHRYNNMMQGNTDDVVTFIQSIKGYGIFWDNYSPTTFIDDKNETSFKSEVGDGIDYYFMGGGNADGVIANMRSLTGQAPMFPLWTFGFWQSRERYKTQYELTDVVKKYREIGVPLDGMIQDWQYWGSNYLWNAMEFLNVDFNNPKKMIKDVHDMNAHMIISIWSSFGPQTMQFKEMEAKGMLMNFQTWPQSGSEIWPPVMKYPSGVKVYDAYNPAARDIYWSYLNKGIFSLGMDGWWMDSTEPDHLDFKPSDLDNKTYLGSFRKVRNAYPLMTVGGVSQHQRETDSKKRVFILTRSAFAGQQRYGANTWSGDITSSWQTFKNQIPAGLNFSLSGLPYWNSDIGGFFLGKFNKRKLDDPEYKELYTRWVEFGAFCPMMRSHGTDAPREIYQFGTKGTRYYDAIAKYINLRYSLLPYIYSTSWDVTAHQSSMMRALYMDFPADKATWNVNHEYMFGKSILVCPVTDAQYVKKSGTGNDAIMVEDFSSTKNREVYLPAGIEWFDLWSGKKFAGGKNVSMETPLDIQPVFVKAGSILPWGPQVQYATEKSWDNLEMRIYAGKDADFTLYEDENDNYNYEKGKYSEIKFHWNDKTRTLTIGERSGKFTGMLNTRKFNLVLNPVGIEPLTGKSITYNGKKTSIKL